MTVTSSLVKSAGGPPTTTPSTVRVISPETLVAGSTFEAEVDGKTFVVTVPEGGVGKGDDFEVPYPTDDEPVAVPIAHATAAGAYKNEATAFEVPTGRWRYGLCDCCSACCCPFWMGWCCFPILVGQLFERLNYNIGGCPANVGSAGGKSPPVCMIFTALTIVFVLLEIIVIITAGVLADWDCTTDQYGYYTCTTGYEHQPLWYKLLVWSLYAFSFFVFVVTCFARMNMRRKYQIKAECCQCGDDNNCCDDCCVTFCCQCCATIQMARHTHDESVYAYNMLSNTGLDANAPEIV